MSNTQENKQNTTSLTGDDLKIISLNEITCAQQEVLDFVLGVRKYIGVELDSSDFFKVWEEPIESDEIEMILDFYFKDLDLNIQHLFMAIGLANYQVNEKYYSEDINEDINIYVKNFINRIERKKLVSVYLKNYAYYLNELFKNNQITIKEKISELIRIGKEIIRRRELGYNII